MRKLRLAACFVILSSTAHAGSIEIPLNGGVARLHIDSNCTQSLCGTASWTDGDSGETIEFALPNVSWKDLERLSITGQPSATNKRKSEKPQKSKKGVAPVATSAPAPAPTTAEPTVANTPAPVSVTPPPATAAAPSVPADGAKTGPTPTAPVPDQKVASLPQSTPVPAPVAAAPATGPMGLWMTENQEGMVRVEQCGKSICGYEVNSKTHLNGKKVLIDMKPAGKAWKGSIHDPRGGGTYDLTVSMKGKDAMRVEGCAFGGLFCGGQTWTRVN